MPAAPRALALLITGLLFTALFLGVPLAHELPRPGARDLALALLPAVILMVAVARPHPALIYALFPAAHLPLVLLRPELAGSNIYRNAWPLLAVLGAGAAYLLAAARRLAPRPLLVAPAPRVLLVVAAVLALAPLIAFMIPALGRDVEPQNAALAAVLGPTASWYAAGRLVPRLLTPPYLSAAGHRAAWAQLADRPPPKRKTFIIAALLAAVALGLAAVWYAWGPPPPSLSGGSVVP